jgi:hypothetical protein
MITMITARQIILPHIWVPVWVEGVRFGIENLASVHRTIVWRQSLQLTNILLQVCLNAGC